MPKVKAPTAIEELAAYLVATDQGAPPTQKEIKAANREKARLRLLIPDSELLRRELAKHPPVTEEVSPDPPNLGPNSSVTLTPEAAESRKPQPFGLLDFQDIALFLWPPHSQHQGFDLEEQCLILKHRNPRLQKITVRELLDIQAWMTSSTTITVEEERVNIREWRSGLSNDDQRALVKRLDQGLTRAKTMKKYMSVNRTEESPLDCTMDMSTDFTKEMSTDRTEMSSTDRTEMSSTDRTGSSIHNSEERSCSRLEESSMQVNPPRKTPRAMRQRQRATVRLIQDSVDESLTDYMSQKQKWNPTPEETPMSIRRSQRATVRMVQYYYKGNATDCSEDMSIQAIAAERPRVSARRQRIAATRIQYDQDVDDLPFVSSEKKSVPLVRLEETPKASERGRRLATERVITDDDDDEIPSSHISKRSTQVATPRRVVGAIEDTGKEAKTSC